jgi:hypothetical protein
MPCLPGERIPFGSTASLIVSTVAEVVLLGSEVHEVEMCAVLAVPVLRALLHEQPARVVRAPDLGLVLRIEDDHGHVDEAASVGGDENGRVVEPRPFLDEPPDEIAQCDGVRSGEPRDGREADVPSLLASVPPGHLVDVEVGDAGLDALVRVLERREVLRRVLEAPHLGARDPLERLLHLAEPVLDDRLVAVEREAHHPAADLELARHLVDSPVGDRLLALVPGRPRGQHRRGGDRVPDLRDVLDRALEHERAQRLDERGEVGVVPDPQPERHVALRVGHQPDAHLRHDPEVRLHEERVEGGAEAALVHVPRAVARHRSHPCPEQLSVREHDLHPAGGRHVGAGREVRRAVLEGVADDAAPAEVGDRDHQPVSARAQRVVEVEPADARLDDGVRAGFVDLEHTVQLAQAHDQRPSETWRGAAVAVVHPRRVRPERDPVLVRDPHDLLDLLDRLGHEHGGRRVVVPRRERERVAELAELVLAGDHRLGAESRAERVQREREALLRQVGRERGCHRAPPVDVGRSEHRSAVVSSIRAGVRRSP